MIRLILFWNVTKRTLVITDVSEQTSVPIFIGQAVNWTAWPMKMGPTGYPETSVTIILRCVTS